MNSVQKQSHPDVIAAGDTNSGLRRDNNEDNLLCRPEQGLFLVCDGMGGMAAGEVASQEVIRVLQRCLTPERLAETMGDAQTMRELLGKAFREANRILLEMVEEHDEYTGMGSTAALALLQGQAAAIANLGDSRVYLLRQGQIEQLTEDHTVAAALVKKGEMDPEEAHEHPLRNHIMGALGLERYREPYVTFVEIVPGDHLLLCSDGLWDMLSDEEIACHVENAGEPEAAVQSLIAAANGAGGKDNITVIVVQIAGMLPAKNTPSPTNEGVASFDTRTRQPPDSV